MRGACITLPQFAGYIIEILSSCSFLMVLNEVLQKSAYREYWKAAESNLCSDGIVPSNFDNTDL